MTTQLIYDETFEGWLSCVFEVYERKLSDVSLCSLSCTQSFAFAEVLAVRTDEQKAARVRKGIEKRLSKEAANKLSRVWLSEISGIDAVMLSYVRYAFDSKQNIEKDFGHPAVLKIEQTNKMIGREKHRMEAFVRFQSTQDGIYYAMVEPDFDVLPLLIPHFQNRYADQRWLIYDVKRKYGIYYNLQETITVSIAFGQDTQKGTDVSIVFDEKELLYQQLWKQYFKSTNIASRKNPRLHVQHMPLRYWKYLTEKKG
ncbi:MAG: TIGR03915 family putative DNA repair protein [Cytophagales bacterium]|nr:TIGR03915 family putative DNA repair protein [Cytophaga sp.]